MSALKAARRTAGGIPWQAPTTIALSLTVGVLLAIGHHLFYSNLHGRQARTDGWQILGSDVSPQQLNIAIGTAIAYLVKTFLLLALSTAYLQLLWRALLRAARGSTLGDLDTAFSGLNNIISLSKVWVWWRLPLLFLLAVIAWLLPLAAVITPATLSIETAQVLPPPSSLQNVPYLAFESLDFADDMPPVPDDDDPDTLRFGYTIPAREVIEVVKAVAATGSVLPINPPSPNASWSMEFAGPALRCSDMSESLSSAIRSNIADATQTASGCTAYGYLAWLEGMPFINGSNDDGSKNNDLVFNSRIFQGSSMPAVLYIAASAEAMTMENSKAPATACSQPVDTLYEPGPDGVMLQCELQSYTYQTSFEYINGIQRVSVSADPLDEQPIQSVPSINCTVSNETDGSCDFTPEVLRTLSYQAIMDAVTYLISGYVVLGENDTSPFISTQVISTALVSTPKLEFVTKPILEQDSTSGARTLQQNVLSWQNTKDQGMVNTALLAPGRSLAETIEQLFQNATVSMMSQDHLQPNASSEFAPGPVNVTRITFHNVYTYSKTKLWIAYGLAVLVTALASILGLLAVAASGASYSASAAFSSAFRLARGASLSTDVRTGDVDGRDPLPEYLAKANMWPEQSRTMQASRVDSMLLSPRRSRGESIALSERPDFKSRSSAVSLLGDQHDIEPPAKPWSGI